MVLNVIDFNNNLQNSYRNRFCIYRNLELGHEIHIYNENSALIKACQSTIEFDIKKILNKIHFSPTYEYYKLFLMFHIGGWFIEEDEIFYDQNLSPKKTIPTYVISHNAFNINFCTWAPIFINLDSSTKFFLKKSLETLKIYLKEGFFDRYSETHREFSYQMIYFEYDEPDEVFRKYISPSGILNFCGYLDTDAIHCATYLLDDFDKLVDKNTKHYDDYSLAKLYYEMDKGNGHIEKVVTYDDLLKFDTFKIMP